ncbi:ABC transporter ATP-binding protein [Rhodococcus sp. G-MC3]|uniref:ABC transporter ATP-binding protein n=1 Tax=Rhodococcus sp. G-MC3 TaxID=3046209 RepID=UPI0024BA4A67|nr:ABC transporter ATP-binding protein [Rhodococcus sp. G-MC3]MDJ0393171.1 ABC transporter ATP-binding protein [Rhodococcus sp. G-MC3]
MPDSTAGPDSTAKPGTTSGARAAHALSAEQRTALFADVPQQPGAAKPDATLVVDGVSRTFGGLKAVDVAHLEIQRGCITGLIGPNGAGKTTLFNLLTGFDRPDTGTWSMDGQSLGKMHPHQVARKGVVRTFQLTKALSKLTVLDNVRLGATGQRGERIFNTLMPWTWKKQEKEVTERAYQLLERFKLDGKADDLAGSMSGGQRKLLEMARALMTDPAVVMLDEPMAGVNPALTQSLLGHIKSLRDDGMTVVFVEHDMDVIRDISDWVVVMAQGSVIAESTPEELSNNGAVVDAYLGSHHDQALEFDSDGNPVGATAALAEALAQAEAEELEAGGDLSEPEFVVPPTLTSGETAPTTAKHAKEEDGK